MQSSAAPLTPALQAARHARPAATPEVAATAAAAVAMGTVAIVGLGLMGGSVARDLAALGIRVLGHDRDPSALRDAMDAGVVAAPLGDGLAGVERADVVIMATPVDEGPRMLALIARALQAAPDTVATRLVTDVGSTKRSILQAAATHGLESRFVGAHPLAGDHRWGWRASRRELFSGARVYLCPADGVDPEALALAHTLWGALGATPEPCDAAAHDDLLAWSSHLPQLSATALALALHRSGVGRTLLGPGGRDTTRLAGSSPEMWTAIARDNATALTAAVELLERQLGELRSVLATGDATRLRSLFSTAQDWFNGPESACGRDQG